VNLLVGEENNLTIDTIFIFFKDLGSMAELIPEQFRFIAHGNGGHTKTVPVILSTNRKLTAFFYRPIPIQDESYIRETDPSSKYITYNEMIREVSTASDVDFFGGVVHPPNLGINGVSEGLFSWFSWVNKNKTTYSLMEQEILENEFDEEMGVSLASEVYFDPRQFKFNIKLTVTASKEIKGAMLTSYFPSLTKDIIDDSVNISGYSIDSNWGKIVWDNQEFSEGQVTIYSYQLNVSEEDSGKLHPTSAFIDSYINLKDGKKNIVWSLGNDQRLSGTYASPFSSNLSEGN
jgi:hypothetical protein